MTTDYPETVVEEPFYEGLDLFWLNFTEEGDVWVCLEHPTNGTYYLTVPQEYLIFE